MTMYGGITFLPRHELASGLEPNLRMKEPSRTALLHLHHRGVLVPVLVVLLQVVAAVGHPPLVAVYAEDQGGGALPAQGLVTV